MREGQVIQGRYQLVSLLGEGGMGAVWRAVHLDLKSPVAVKLLNPLIAASAEGLTRFHREAEAAAALRSPHVVQILDRGIDSETKQPFIVMELMEGESLAGRIAREGRLSPAQTSRVITHVARALLRAHEAGIVHRDLKPDNVFLVRNEDEEIGKVLDFGIAKSDRHGVSQGSDTRTGAVMGTPYYMSPEQISGAKGVDFRADIWALGVIAFECLTGKRPFEADSIGGLALKICAEPMPVPSSLGPVPAAFDKWFEKAAARVPTERFASAREAAEELRRVCGIPSAAPERPTDAGPRPNPPVQTVSTGAFVRTAGQGDVPPAPRPSPIRWVLGGVVAVAVAVAAGGALLLGGSESSEEQAEASASSAPAAAPVLAPPEPAVPAAPSAPAAMPPSPAPVASPASTASAKPASTAARSVLPSPAVPKPTAAAAVTKPPAKVAPSVSKPTSTKPGVPSNPERPREGGGEVINMFRILTALAICSVLAWAGQVHAQDASNAAAEALFQEGRALLQEGKHDEACPKLAESYRLDPSTGTLIVLGLCHEAQGKLATAWAEFTSAEARGRREGREDREKLARERATALRPRLSTLAIDVPPEVAATPGLEVKLDGAVTGAFGTAVPVDGGEHRIDATAPGKKPYSTIITVKTESDAVRTSVPALVDGEPASAAVPGSPAAKVPSAKSEEKPWPAMRTAALITAGAGVIALGVGSYLALDAKADYDDADGDCNEDGTCPNAPFEATEDARSQGTIATVVFAVGGAAIGTGVALWFLAPSGGDESPTAARVRIERVGVGPQGVTLRGSF